MMSRGSDKQSTQMLVTNHSKISIETISTINFDPT